MTFVFYRSVGDGWRVGVTKFLEGANVCVCDGEVEETVAMTDIYVPRLPSGEGDADALLHMEDHPVVFLEKRDAALMSPTPLVGMPSLIQLLRHRAASDEFTTCIGGNFFLLLGEGSLLDVDPPGQDTILRAVFAWRGSRRRQVVVSCGSAQPVLFGNLLETCCKLLGGAPTQRKMVLAGMNVLSAFITTAVGQQQLCYLQGNIFARPSDESKGDEFQGISVECNHLFTSGIGSKNNSNFKIFSYILYGLGDEEREQFFINRKQHDFVCQSSIEDESLVLGLQKEYLRFTDDMDTLGMSSASQLALLRQVAIVIHLTEIEFYADGSLANLPALRSVARLCQLNVDECLEIFFSREVCVTAARLLYNAILLSILRKINCVFGVPGELGSSHPSLTVLAMPSLSLGETSENELDKIVLAAVYEGLLQAFIVSSDQEVTQWQSAGLHVSEKLQSALEKFDNYRLLKVLYGVGGVLSVAREAHEPDKLILALKNCAKNANVTFDVNTLLLTIEHFFGKWHYQFPRNPEERLRLRSVHHADFEPLCSFLIEKADFETQETLRYFDQAKGKVADQVVALEMFHVKPLLELLRDGRNAFWWIGNIDSGVVFDGKHVEKQLRELPVLCAVELRQLLPYHYIMCSSAFIASTFKPLLPPGKEDRTSNTQKLAEAILFFCDSKCSKMGDNFFLSSSALVEMDLKVKALMCQQATLIQTFARCCFCTIALKQRVAAWMARVESTKMQQNQVIEEYRHKFRSQNLFRMQLLDLFEEENSARTIILEEYWEESVALKAEFQAKLEGFLVQVFTSSIKREEKQLNLIMENNNQKKFQMINAHIQQRIKDQQAYLDGIVDKQLEKHEGQTYAQRLRKVYKNVFSESLQREKRRKVLDAAKKQKEAKLSLRETRFKEEFAGKSEKTNQRRSQYQFFRDKLSIAQDELNEALAVQMAVRDAEDKVLRSVKEELVSFRRQQNERLLLKLREERQQMRATLSKVAKANEQRAAQRELRERRAAEAEQRRKQRAGWQRLHMQQLQQRAVERQRQAAERRRREVARAVLAALPTMETPVLYEHIDERKVVRSRSCNDVLLDGFVLTGGNKTYSRMLSESSMRGLLEYHARKPRAKSPYPHLPVRRK